MDFSDKSSSSPSPSRRSATPQASPSDENDPSNRKMGSGRQSPKTRATVKFSSPTKPAGSRKKILAERNEASASIFSTTQNPKATFANSDEDEQNGFVADSSSRPYDPVTNYLSPRPKFLRYQPNRRRQILLSIGKDGSGSSSRSLSFDPQAAVGEEGSSVSSSQEENSLKQDDEEIDEEIEEEEEEEERGNWVLRGVLKSFLLFVVLALCTSYTCSMNSQTPALQAVWDMKDGYERIQDMITEAVKNLEGSEVDEMFGDSDVLWVSKDATVAAEDEEKVAVYSLGDDVKEEEEGTIGDIDESSENKEATAAQDSELLDSRENEEIMDTCETLAMTDDGTNIASDASLDVSGTEVEVVMKQEVSNKEEARDEEEVVETEMEKRIEILVAEFLDIKERYFHSESSVLIGAAIGFGLIVASVVMGSLHLNKKTRAGTEKDASSTLITKHCSEPEKHSSVVAAPMEEEKKTQLGSSKQSIQPTEKEDKTSHAPRIQMLSEFAVSSSVSMRSCSTKPRRGIEEDETSTNYSGSVPVRPRPEMPELSRKSNSQSYGSFTAEKKMVKKSGGGKENVEVTTPMRRSSRIRSRSITSPQR